MRNRKLLSFVLTISLLLSSVATYGAERENEAEASVSSLLKAEVSALSSLNEGEDYAESEGVFLADTEEEAREVAASYNAELISYERGVATVRFHESTVAALNHAASLSSVKKVIEPNYKFELFDEIDDEEIDIEEADTEIADTDEIDTGEIDVSDALEADIEEAAAEEIADEETAEINSIDVVLDAADPFASSSSKYYQYYHAKINDEAALKTVSGENVKVAVIDTGCNPEQEELVGRVSLNYIESCKSAKGVDKHGHGTHVIGIIAAAKDNGKGGYGVAPGVSINSIQCTVTGSNFYLSHVAEAVRMAIDMDVQVISMSLGASSNSSYLQTLIDEAYEKGIVCVAAAGNGVKTSTGNIGADEEHYPAAGEHCLSVAASTQGDALADYSNYGSWVDIVAPGDKIYSSYIYKAGYGTTSANSYGGLSGTSQATPIVAAVAALCYSSNSAYIQNKNSNTTELISSVLLVTSDGKEYESATSGGEVVGLVQADKAVEVAKNLSLSGSYTLVDKAGHYGRMMTGWLCEKKSTKLYIGNSSGNKDKKLTKSATWTSSDTSKVTVKKGKVKATKAADDGDRVLISAAAGGETLYYILNIQDKVKKFGLMDSASYKVASTAEVSVRKGAPVYISSPFAAVSDNNIRVFYTAKKSELAKEDKDDYSLADGRFKYSISISKKDLRKVTVNKTDTNGDALVLTPAESGTFKIKYKLLDGSNKKFTVKVNVR